MGNDGEGAQAAATAVADAPGAMTMEKAAGAPAGSAEEVPMVGSCLCGCGPCTAGPTPEETCLGKMSRGGTLPFCLQSRCVRGCMEHAACCVCCGGLGCEAVERKRGPLMMANAAIAMLGWVMIVVAVVSTVMTDPSGVRSLGWSKGKVVASALPGATGIEIYIGPQAFAVYLPFTLEHIKSTMGAAAPGNATGSALIGSHADGDILYNVWKEEDSCVLGQAASFDSTGGPISTTDMCKSCREQATAVTMLVFMGLITQIPQILTSFQRATPFGDMNCQKTVGMVTSLLGMVSTLAALYQYAQACHDGLPTEATIQGLPVTIEWSPALGFACIGIATALKVLDLVCHIVLPTPKAKRSRGEKWDDTLAGYMARCPEPTRCGALVDSKAASAV